MAFNFKKIGKNAGNVAMDLGAVTVGTLATAKFMNFEQLFPNMDKEKFLIKHQGGVKAGAAFIILSMFGDKMPGWAKMLVLGVAVEGAIREVRVLTTGESGVSMFSQIGQNEAATDAQIDAAARQITTQFLPGVAGNEYDQMEWNRETAVGGRNDIYVAGMGQSDSKIYRQ